MVNIICVARLVEYISGEGRTKDEIVSAIKEERENGTITEEEALELVIEYIR